MGESNVWHYFALSNTCLAIGKRWTLGASGIGHRTRPKQAQIPRFLIRRDRWNWTDSRETGHEPIEVRRRIASLAANILGTSVYENVWG
jgi:hypothetical protein